MALGDGDMAILFSDFAETVTFGGVTAKAIVDGPSKDGIFDKVSVSDAEYKLTLPADAFTPQPKPKDAISVVTGRYAGSYFVRCVDPLEDGAIVEIKLRVRP